jgi:hypothetical protein
MLNDWDPIGVCDGDDQNPSPDEYEDLVSPILTALRIGDDGASLAGQLREVLSADYGVTGVDDIDEFAEQVTSLTRDEPCERPRLLRADLPPAFRLDARQHIDRFQLRGPHRSRIAARSVFRDARSLRQPGTAGELSPGQAARAEEPRDLARAHAELRGSGAGVELHGLDSRPAALASIHRRSWVRAGRALGELRASCGRGGAAGLAARGVPLRVSARAWSAGRTGCSALWRPRRMSEQHRPGGLPGPGVGQVQPDAPSGGRDPRRDGDQFPADRRRGRFR